MLGTSKRGLKLGGVCKTGAAFACLKKVRNKKLKKLWHVFVFQEIMDKVRNYVHFCQEL
jgi:hypothetical protein